MTSTEQKSLINARITAVEQRLDAMFDQVEVNGEKCYRTADGRVFLVTAIYSQGAIVIEYADDVAAAAQNAYEDGDLFYLEEMGEEEMLESILREIN